MRTSHLINMTESAKHNKGIDQNSHLHTQKMREPKNERKKERRKETW